MSMTSVMLMDCDHIVQRKVALGTLKVPTRNVVSCDPKLYSVIPNSSEVCKNVEFCTLAPIILETVQALQ